MKKIIFTFSLFFLVFNLTAQDSKISVTLSYPIPVGDNFASSYTGIVDLGLQARLIEAGPLAIGVSANADYSRNSVDSGSTTFKEAAFLIQPRVFGELNLDAIAKFKPFIGLGYTFAIITADPPGGAFPDKKNKYGGINFNLGAAYNITEMFFVLAQFDGVKLSRDVPQQEVADFYSKISHIELGVGVRF